MVRPAFFAAAIGVAVATGVFAQQPDTARTDAASMRKKLGAILDRSEVAPAPKRPAPAPLRTGFTDREVNAYFKLDGPEFLPEGLVEPRLTIDEGGKVQARAIVDLDAALKPKERSVLDPLAWLGGKTEVTAAGVVTAANGMGTLQLQTATVGGIPVPTSLLQQLVSYYTRTPELPGGFDLQKPFKLPANIRSVELRRGQAVIVQP